MRSRNRSAARRGCAGPRGGRWSSWLLGLVTALAACLALGCTGGERGSPRRGWRFEPWSRAADEPPGIYWGSAPLADGALLLVGESHSQRGDRDATIARFDGDGRLVLKRTLGGDDDDFLLALCPTNDGGLIAVGATDYRGAGLRDGWVVRLDATLEVLWQWIGGGPRNDTLTSCALGDDGSVVVAGTRGDPRDRPQAWVMRFDTSGLQLVDWVDSLQSGSGVRTLVVDGSATWIGGFRSPQQGLAVGALWLFEREATAPRLVRTFEFAEHVRLVALRRLGDGVLAALFESGVRFGSLNALRLIGLELSSGDPQVAFVSELVDQSLVRAFDLVVEGRETWILAERVDQNSRSSSRLYRVADFGAAFEVVDAVQAGDLHFTTLARLAQRELRLAGARFERDSQPEIYRLSASSP